ncbi:MAG: hypothetical protein JJ896_13065 [Rhodothermales bacterium]|nr:hypothetical protein [Rhodothermales bacterium]MBO6780577.1 hypothetical protein [Rhodothermales bacterium]
MSKGTREIEGWVSVFNSGTDYEADLVRDRLDDSGIPAVVLTLRDHAFNLTHGSLSRVHVYVPEDQVDAVRHVMSAEPLTDDELAAVALAADPESPPKGDVIADSGAEHINLSPPEDPA